MENIFDTVFKQEVITTITEHSVNDYVKSLTEFIDRFYMRKKIFGYTAIAALVLVLSLYKYTSGYLPKLMQKMFPNDLAFIVYCTLLILIVGIPTLLWYNMDTHLKKSKINTLETLNYTIQSYFESGAKKIDTHINFNTKEYKQKEVNGDHEIYDYVTLHTAIDSVLYHTRLFISTQFTINYGRIPAKGRNGNTSKTSYYLYLETICTVPKSGNPQKEIPYINNGIQTKCTDAPDAFNYGFITNGKIDTNVANAFTKPFVKSYIDYLILSVKKR